MNQVISVEPQADTTRSLAGKYLTFRLGEEDYGIDVLHIREIIGMFPVTKIPRAPDCVRGVINLRGKVIPVVDLRAKFDMPQIEYTKQSCIIIVEVHGVASEPYHVGLIVDTVNDVVVFTDRDLEPAPAYANGLRTSFIKAMGKTDGKVRILLDTDHLLSREEIMKLQETRA